MHRLEFLNRFNVHRNSVADADKARLSDRREENAADFYREAADVPACDLVGQWPHIYEPHDRKVDPYRVAGFLGAVGGALVVYVLTNMGVVEPTWKAMAAGLMIYAALAKLLEARFTAAAPVATDSSTCFLISTLLLRELSRNQVSKKTLGRRSTRSRARLCRSPGGGSNRHRLDRTMARSS